MTLNSLSSARNWIKQVAVFLALLCLFSIAAYALVLHSHHMDAPLSRFTMWCPGFAALSTCLFLRVPVGSLGWSWPAPRFLKLAYFLPLIYAAPVYLVTWLAINRTFSLQSFEATMSGMYGLGQRPIFGTFAVALPLLFTVNVIATCVWALGEELGWRGFLFPRLHQRVGFHGACLISGAIWAVWHFPGLLWADYNVGTNPLFAMSCFTLGVIAMAYIMGYLRLRSGSIWPCVLVHATHNTFVQGIYDQLTAPVGVSKYITSEFGAGLALSIVIAAVILVSNDRHASGLSVGQEIGLQTAASQE
ncbi:membrane protease YdiL (CAAX protease family) [Acidipila rosea]|uniref:Membrane protease YdiL (CAAX protease family) n=1 Tax=Acidipila rosea TaxID=768535 RepID=A0A4V2PUH8_9BACT|nr:membrane protease YdiL (CAAX protease family) [Acidipila rosea]